MEHTKEYDRIDKALTRLERGGYAPLNIDWCINRIDWAWKWHKITQEQMETLAERCCALLDKELNQICKRRRYE